MVAAEGGVWGIRMSLAAFVRRLSGVLLVCVTVFAGGCVTGAIAPGVVAPASSMDDYRLGPGDVLRIAVFNEAALSGQFPIGPRGTIAFPLAGDVPAEGKTTTEFVATLVNVLKDGIVREPSVTVEVATYRPFYLMGEVGAPGNYAFMPGLTVANAVAAAGDFTERASRRRVFIRHAGESAEREYPLTTTTLVRPGDTVRIPERRF